VENNGIFGNAAFFFEFCSRSPLAAGRADWTISIAVSMHSENAMEADL
jgi:hypothetical protein